MFLKENQNYKLFNYNGIEYVSMDENLIFSTERNFEEVTYGMPYTYDLSLYKIINEDAPIKKKLLIVIYSF